MTLAVGCQFAEGAVIFADSRVTWNYGSGHTIPQDSLKKILPLPPNACIAYAGDIEAATKVIHLLNLRIQKDRRLQSLEFLGPKIGPITRHIYKTTIEKRGISPKNFSLIIGGIQGGNDPTNYPLAMPRMWQYSSPLFTPVPITTFAAIGSGAEIVTPFLRQFWEELMNEPGIDGKISWLLQSLPIAMEYMNDATVGGLFQGVRIEPAKGIRAIIYGVVHPHPEQSSPTTRMTIEDGVWTQKNFMTGSTVSTLHPSALLTGGPSRVEARSYSRSKIDAIPLDSFLTYFIPCLGTRQSKGHAYFFGKVDAFAIRSFPAHIPILSCIAIHPELDSFKLSVLFGKERETMKVLYDVNIEKSHIMEEFRMNPQIVLAVTEPGIHFLELWVDVLRLSRHPLLIVPMLPAIKDMGNINPRLLLQQIFVATENLKSNLDNELKDGEYFLEYFVPCISANLGGPFVDMSNILYPPKLPCVFPHLIVSGFRAKPGKYKVKNLLTEVANREMTDVGETTIKVTSDLLVTDLLGKLQLPFKRPGIYVLDQFIEDKRLARAHYVVNDYGDPLPAFLKLIPEDIDNLQKGNFLAFSRHSTMAVEETTAQVNIDSQSVLPISLRGRAEKR